MVLTHVSMLVDVEFHDIISGAFIILLLGVEDDMIKNKWKVAKITKVANVTKVTKDKWPTYVYIYLRTQKVSPRVLGKDWVNLTQVKINVKIKSY